MIAVITTCSCNNVSSQIYNLIGETKESDVMQGSIQKPWSEVMQGSSDKESKHSI